MKRVISTILVIAIASIFGSFTKSTQAKYSGGSGDPNTPYQIANVADLLTLANDANDYNKCFILTADINLDPCLPGNRIFTSAVIASGMSDTNDFNESPFTGVFDGTEHKILNLTILDANSIGNRYLGLFGYVSNGIVKNLVLENVRITSGNNERPVGGLAGVNEGSISNCFTSGNISSAQSGGLLVGENQENISNCHTTGFVSGLSSGGLVGFNNGDISDCFATGAVSGSGYLGGLVGRNYAGHITNCYSTGNVSGDGILGGLVGSISGNWLNHSNIRNCYSTGNVTGSVTDSLSLGGLVGGANDGNIINCYSTGIVTAENGTMYLGGLIGFNYSNINSSYFLVTSGPNNGHGTPLTDSQMKQKTSFTGWDFNDVWKINEGIGYPKLAWQPKYSGGSGDPNDPYQIANVADLMTLANDANDYNKCFIMTDDIDLDPCLPGNQVFSTGVIDYGFSGVFDGAGKKISNLTIDSNDANSPLGNGLGLFRQSSGIVKNLILENVNINSVTAAPYQSGWFGGLMGQNSGSVINCSTTGVIIAGDITYYLGGLVGQNTYDSNIISCFSSVAIEVGESSLAIGGLVGYNNGNISNSFAIADVNAKRYTGSLGGLVGQNFSRISKCFSMGSITVGNDTYDLGGLVGTNWGGSIDNCYSRVTIKSGNVSGIGGLVGGVENSILLNCYSAGVLNPGPHPSLSFGGLVGSVDGDITINNCYFLNTSGPNNGYGTPLADSQMKQQASFVNWDFADIWHICESTNYPKLLWQIPAADFVCPDGINFADFSFFAERWLDMNCAANNNCDKTDFDLSGTVDLNDLSAFADNWLVGF